MKAIKETLVMGDEVWCMYDDGDEHSASGVGYIPACQNLWGDAFVVARGRLKNALDEFREEPRRDAIADARALAAWLGVKFKEEARASKRTAARRPKTAIPRGADCTRLNSAHARACRGIIAALKTGPKIRSELMPRWNGSTPPEFDALVWLENIGVVRRRRLTRGDFPEVAAAHPRATYVYTLEVQP